MDESAKCTRTRGGVWRGFPACRFPCGGDVRAGRHQWGILVGRVPGGVWLFGMSPVKSLPLLGRREFEVAHRHRNTEISCCRS